MKAVNTDYVFISRGVVKFTENSRLDTLLNTITTTIAVAVASSTRSVETGQVLYLFMIISI